MSYPTIKLIPLNPDVDDVGWFLRSSITLSNQFMITDRTPNLTGTAPTELYRRTLSAKFVVSIIVVSVCD